ncbi:hypothetical protein J437_LFUL008494 [Ladona fulva]|uniref:Uncharacterized protein n=1 Tax=Ladona fulva TaxID=123851 RepID=A0A8K0P264_LADFU|nr:hypothetical protein J437_LFUL008494 [Ladona fulva]
MSPQEEATKKADDEGKDQFYEFLKEQVAMLPGYDMKIILGDTNAKILEDMESKDKNVDNNRHNFKAAVIEGKRCVVKRRIIKIPWFDQECEQMIEGWIKEKRAWLNIKEALEKVAEVNLGVRIGIKSLPRNRLGDVILLGKFPSSNRFNPDNLLSVFFILRMSTKLSSSLGFIFLRKMALTQQSSSSAIPGKLHV